MNVHILYTFSINMYTTPTYGSLNKQLVKQNKTKQTNALQHMNDGGIICVGGS